MSECNEMWPSSSVDNPTGFMWDDGSIDANIMWPQTQWPYCISFVAPFDGCVVTFSNLDFLFSSTFNTDFDYTNTITLNYNYTYDVSLNYIYSFNITESSYKEIINYFADFIYSYTVVTDFIEDFTTIIDFDEIPDINNLDIPLIVDFEGISNYDSNFLFNISFPTEINFTVTFSNVEFCDV